MYKREAAYAQFSSNMGLQFYGSIRSLLIKGIYLIVFLVVNLNLREVAPKDIVEISKETHQSYLKQEKEYNSLISIRQLNSCASNNIKNKRDVSKAANIGSALEETPLHNKKVDDNKKQKETTSLASVGRISDSKSPVKLQQLTRNELYISELPFGSKFSKKLEQYSGHILIGPNELNTVFFWLIKSAHAIGNKKLMFWLNGGPGCTSMTGALLEIGPFRYKYLNGTHHFEDNESDATHHASVVFVDQPSGVGLSHRDNDSPYPDNHKDWTDSFVEFVRKFLNIFPEYLGSEIYLTGESFSGYYLPHFTKALMDNISSIPGLRQTDIKGIIVGNPYLDPYTIDKSYYTYLEKHKAFPEEYMTNTLAKVKDECHASLDEFNKKPNSDKLNYNDYCEFQYFNDAIVEASRKFNGNGDCINVYNVNLYSKKCGFDWPEYIEDMTIYFGLPEVRENLHIDLPGVETRKFKECSVVSKNITDEFDNSATGAFVLAELLNKYKHFKTVILEGDMDLICNVDGVTESISKMNLGNAPVGMAKFSHKKWLVEKAQVGEFYEYDRLQYYIIYGGSHMPAIDNPMAVYNIFLRSTGIESEGPESSLVDFNKNATTNTVKYVSIGVGSVLLSSAIGLTAFKLYKKRGYNQVT